MHLQHFGLHRNPFEGPADPRMCHPTRAHRAALDALVESLRAAQSPILLEGPRGCGKTMLLRSLANSLPEGQQLVVIETEARRQGGPWPAMEAALGLASTRDERSSEESVRRYLQQRGSSGMRTAIAFDDTHNLPDYWIEQIDLMTADNDLSVEVVLAADTDFGAVSRSPAAVRVRERFESRVRIEPIVESECRGYIEALLMSAGAREPRIFSDAALQALYADSRGLPSAMAALAGRAMLVAYGRGADRVEDEAVQEASRQLRGGRAEAPPPPVTQPAAPTQASPEARVRPIVEPLHKPRPQQLQDAEMVQAVAAQGGARLAVGGGFVRRASDPYELRAEGTTGTSGPLGVVPGGPVASAAGPGAGSGSGAARGFGAGAGQGANAPALETAKVTPIAGPRLGSEASRIQEQLLQQEVLAGIPRPDRPRWDRAKHDPYRNPVPEDPPFGPEGLPVVSDPHGNAAEWFRVLRLGLEDWMEQQAGNTHSVLVTSADAGAGKTFVAANLALLFANEPGIRVLLVDANMRRPRFEGLFGVPSRPGLADVLSGRAELESSISFISEVGLSVMTAGRSGNPRDLSSSDRFGALLQQMKHSADLVIVDAPPLDPWVDARSLAAAADGVLLVARSGQSRAPEILRGVRALDGGNLIGAVLTGVEGPSSRRHAAQRRRRG